MNTTAYHENLKTAENAIAQHDQVCKCCVHPSRRETCRVRYDLEQAAIKAFKKRQ